MKLNRWFAATSVAALTLAVVAARGLAQDAASSGGDKPTYLGDKACQKCHFQEHKSWKKTGLYKAMETLKPTDEAANKALFDKKKAANLDPAKDYSTDAKCVKCHTTGYGVGGYPAKVETDDEKKAAETFGRVGCESCHGPGSLYVKFKTDELGKNKDAKFTKEQLTPLGLVVPDEKTCKTCHNDESPTKAEFKYDEEKVKTHPTKK